MSEAALGFQPLHRHVREHLMQRVIDGHWAPGDALPSEQQLALEMGVSQGTVRKALDALAAENVVVRRQGRGTFVAVPEEGRLLFQFYSLRRDDGTRILPESRVESVRLVAATAEVRRRLDLPPRSMVWEVERTRTLEGQLITAETLTIPADRFPGFGEIGELPNNLYMLYATRFGQIVGRAEEHLKAVTAGRLDCERLGCRKGSALLLIDRVAFGLDRLPIEWRRSRCLTERFHYKVELR